MSAGQHVRHRRRSPDPGRPADGLAVRSLRIRSRWHRHQGGLDKAGVSGEQVEYVIMGQVLTAGAGQIPARQAAVDARHPDVGARLDRQQGVPVGSRRHRAGRPADPRRRIRCRRRRRAGVDVPGAAPARKVARRFQVRRRDPRRPPRLRRPARRLHRAGDGCPDRGRQHRHRPAKSRTPSPPPRINAPRRPGRTGSSTTRSSRSPSPSAGATRSCSPTTKASAPTPRPSRCQAAAGFSKTGTITAGNASTDQRRRSRRRGDEQSEGEELGLDWLAEIGAHGVVAGPDSTLQQQPANAITAACAVRASTPSP